VFVVKYGGSFMDSPDEEERHRVARDIVFLEAVGINPVVVHGGGKAITRALQTAGLKAEFAQGHRVTDAATVEIVDRVLSREVNPEIVTAIEDLGGSARGFAGSDIFRCRKLLRDDVDLGFVGDVVDVDTDTLRACIQLGATPVISPTARGDDGKIYNCNADIAAAKTAIALKARRLVFMSDVAGLLRDPTDDSTLMSHLRVEEVPELKRAGVIGEGMLPKVDSATAAIESGVEKVQFVDGRIPHSVLLEIFTDAGVGTEVVR
jgi:acetylglutamate kinase